MNFVTDYIDMERENKEFFLRVKKKKRGKKK